MIAFICDRCDTLRRNTVVPYAEVVLTHQHDSLQPFQTSTKPTVTKALCGDCAYEVAIFITRPPSK